METIMGFVAGYLAGSQDGKDGVERIRTSLIAIKDSAEVRRLAGEAGNLTGRLIGTAGRRCRRQVPAPQPEPARAAARAGSR